MNISRTISYRGKRLPYVAPGMFAQQFESIIMKMLTNVGV